MRLPSTRQLLTSLGLAFSLLLAATATHAGGQSDAAGEMKMSKEMMRAMVGQSMQMFQVAEDVTFEDAIESMKLRANNLNFKMVAELPLSEQVKAMGEDANPMNILAFCDALIAKRMVAFDKIFAGFLPCRVAIITDDKGVSWIITMNMDMMLNAVDLPPELAKDAKTVRDNIYSIVDAGVNGDL